MRTNVDSVYLVGKAVARHMIKRRRGRIINVCSVQSELGRPNIAPIPPAKARSRCDQRHGIDWGKYGINVNGSDRAISRLNSRRRWCAISSSAPG